MVFKHSYTFICDDVRQEITGKLIVIGLYTGPIIVSHIPQQLLLTAGYVLETDRPGRYPVTFRIEHLETGRRLGDGQGQIMVTAPGTLIAPFKVPLQIDAEGAYHFILEANGETFISTFTVALLRQQNFPAGAFPMPPMR